MNELSPRINLTSNSQGQTVASLSGSWTAGELTAPRIWKLTLGELEKSKSASSWDLRPADAIDHLGALMLWNFWGQKLANNLHANQEQLAVLNRIGAHPPQPTQNTKTTFAKRVDNLGIAVIGAVEQVKDFHILMGQLLLDFLKLLIAPAKAPWRDFSGHLYKIGANALPITALVGFLIGVVLSYLMSQVLIQFGAQTYIVNILGLSLIRELGPMLAAILIAGRSGSAITAQIGVMQVTEELDAMRVLGISTGFRLVLPRALALIICMPLIAVWTTSAALIGGILAADLTLGINISYFAHTLPDAVPIANLWLAIIKSSVFGVSIALIGCHYGLRVEPNTESLGQGTTSSVVASITAVILIDALFAVLFKSVGMS